MIKIMLTFSTSSCYSCYIAGLLKTIVMKVSLPALYIITIIVFSCTPEKVNPDNPLMIDFNTPLQSVPFDKIETRHYKPAIQAAIDEARTGLDKIADASNKPTFQNTVEALEFLNYKVKRLEQVFFNINSAETSKEIQQIAQEISPLLTAYYNDISLNEALFARVKQVYNGRENLQLQQEESKLLEDTYRGFVRNGANLTNEAKEEYRKVTEELSMLNLKFEENLLDETNAYQLQLTNEKDLDGIPDFVKEAAAMEAKAKGLDGWLFTLKAPSYQPFMKYADNRKLREEIYRAYNTRCFKQNDKNNEEIIRKIVNYRLRLANLLGYKTYADYILEERMAKTPDKVSTFLHDLLHESKPTALREYDEVQAYARKIGADFEIQRWDWSYYAEKLKNERFSISDEMTKPYFRLENVETGIFNLAGKLYGITFRSDTTIPVYHQDVKTFRVFDEDGSLLALLYVDYFPREGKQGGAWMTNYLEQHWSDGSNIRPHVSLVLNFTKPTGTRPSLLTYDEVRTFLHEFGHALHSILSNCTYMSLSGTNVYRDFVELPSQIMENWAEQKEWLNQVAVHYETGARIPDELLKSILKSRNFNSGYAFVRQLSFGLNDMAWHTLSDSLNRPVTEVEQETMAQTELFPPVKGCSFSTGFAHIFSGGYAAGYYGYKWAEVLDADAFSLFEKRGIYDRATAKAFRDNILSRGGTEDPMTLYIRFRGQEPTIEPLLERSGLR
jgi:peptidyl-dipeptidase Dcp